MDVIELGAVQHSTRYCELQGHLSAQRLMRYNWTIGALIGAHETATGEDQVEAAQCSLSY
jgi:hypothetical protein